MKNIIKWLMRFRVSELTSVFRAMFNYWIGEYLFLKLSFSRKSAPVHKSVSLCMTFFMNF